MAKIICNRFVTRQTETSSFSHFDGTWKELEDLVGNAKAIAVKEGYRNGVILVPVPPERFYCAVVDLNTLRHPENVISATFASRRAGEQPFVQVTTALPKQQAKYVEIVLYSRDVLKETKDNTDETADWEIISINARITEEPEPPTPMAMARNFLQLTGGTKATYTAEEFAKAIVYWSSRVFVS